MRLSLLTCGGLLAVATLSAAEPQRTDSTKQVNLQEAVVQAVRAPRDAPFAVSRVSGRELSAFSTSGRELPFLFAHTPGVVAWGENGLGTGTTYLRIRGASGSRVNVTLDGVALNSPEDQTVFWANMNSFAAFLGSAQIQRGVGTSTNGDGAFGGTISLATQAPSLTPRAELSAGYGSFNTYNVGGSFSTGLLWKRLSLDAAYHHTGTDGYLHGTSGNSGSFFGALTWHGDNFRLRYTNVANYEHTGQAWNGVTAGNDDATLMSADIRTYKDLYKRGLGRYNSLYESLTFDENSWSFPTDANGKYQTSRYRLDDGSLWDKTTDNFVQDHNIFSASWQPSARWTHTAALHYTYGHGYYREFRPQNKFSKFGLLATDADGNTQKRADFIRRKGLTQHTYGLVYSLNYKDTSWDVLGGLNLQQFRGNHYGYLDYVSGLSSLVLTPPASWAGDWKYYDSDARKFDYSAYVKATLHAAAWWDIFADVQYRRVHYKTSGVNDKFTRQADGNYLNQRLDIHKDYNFFNPKGGFNFHFGRHRFYLSAAYAGREPERNNFTDNGAYPAPKAEHLIDCEGGYQYSGSNWHAGINLYRMDYHNQFVQTGQQSDIGENLTTNIRRSYREGIELTADWTPLSWLTLAGNAAFSRNRLKDFTEYAEDWYAADGYRTLHYSSSPLAFSPSTLLNGFLTLRYRGLNFVWHTNFVSRQYLDNTGCKDRSLPGYSQTDLDLSYALHPKRALREVVFGLRLNNLFDRHYAASGWVYSAYDRENMADDEARYYQIGFIPMAGTTLMGSVTLRF